MLCPKGPLGGSITSLALSSCPVHTAFFRGQPAPGALDGIVLAETRDTALPLKTEEERNTLVQDLWWQELSYFGKFKRQFR